MGVTFFKDTHHGLVLLLGIMPRKLGVGKGLFHASLLASLVGIVGVLAGCQRVTLSPSQAWEPTAAAIKVAVVVPPYGWLVEQIGGPRVEVVPIFRGSTCAETFQPTDAEVSQLLSCRILLRAGLPFENSPWFRNLLAVGTFRIVDLREEISRQELSGGRQADFWEAIAQVGDGQKQHGVSAESEQPQRHEECCKYDHHNHDHAHHNHHHQCYPEDPHRWLSPRLLKVQAQIIAKALAETDKENTPLFEENVGKLSEYLDHLDREVRTTLAGAKGHRFLVFHPAWGHFAEEYGLEQIAIEKDGSPPSDAELSALAQRVRAEGIRGIVVESLDPHHPAISLARGLQLMVVPIVPTEEQVDQTLRKIASFVVDYGF